MIATLIIRHYYHELRRLHPTMKATVAIKQARIWVGAGYLDIPFYPEA